MLQSDPLLGRSANPEGDEEDDEVAMLSGHASRWKDVFTPRRVLGFFVMINLLTYFDRGAMSSALGHIKTDASINQPYPSTIPVPSNSTLSDTKLGTLGSCFMVGFMVFCPTFATLSTVIKPTRLVAVGLSIWALATFISGCAPAYGILLAARSFVGVGEASFLWLGLFFAAIPVGQALGIAIGGVVSSQIQWGSVNGWRLVFIGEALLMLPLVLLCFFIPDNYNTKPGTSDDPFATGDAAAAAAKRRLAERRKSPSPEDLYESACTPAAVTIEGAGEGQPATLTYSPPLAARVDQTGATVSATQGLDDTEQRGAAMRALCELCRAVKTLATNAEFVMTSLGYAMFTGAIGAIAFWAPDFIERALTIDISVGGPLFGLITVVTGVAGSVLGGKILDAGGGSTGPEGIFISLRFMVGCAMLAFPFGIASFVAKAPTLFFILVTITELLLFSTFPATNAVLLSVVPTEMRSFSMSFNVLIIHLLGDFPSPLLVGVLVDKVFHDLRPALLAVYMILAPCIVFWSVGCLLAYHKCRSPFDRALDL